MGDARKSRPCVQRHGTVRTLRSHRHTHTVTQSRRRQRLTIFFNRTVPPRRALPRLELAQRKCSVLTVQAEICFDSHTHIRSRIRTHTPDNNSSGIMLSVLLVSLGARYFGTRTLCTDHRVHTWWEDSRHDNATSVRDVVCSSVGVVTQV